MITPDLPEDLRPGPGWSVVSRTSSRFAHQLVLSAGGSVVDVRFERCAAGRLRDAYPAGAHDVQIHAGCRPGARTPPPAALLRALARAVARADPRCRRIVVAVPAAESDGLAAAVEAGLRHAVDVDLDGRELSLLVHEPDWVTATDMDLGHVPGT